MVAWSAMVVYLSHRWTSNNAVFGAALAVTLIIIVGACRSWWRLRPGR